MKNLEEIKKFRCKELKRLEYKKFEDLCENRKNVWRRDYYKSLTLCEQLKKLDKNVDEMDLKACVYRYHVKTKQGLTCRLTDFFKFKKVFKRKWRYNEVYDTYNIKCTL